MGCSRGDRATNTRCLQSHTLFAGHFPELCPRDEADLRRKLAGRSLTAPRFWVW